MPTGKLECPVLQQFALPRVDWGQQAILKATESWLRQAPAQDNPVAWNHFGRLLTMKSENEKARQCYQKAAALGFASANLSARE